MHDPFLNYAEYGTEPVADLCYGMNLHMDASATLLFGLSLWFEHPSKPLIGDPKTWTLDLFNNPGLNTHHPIYSLSYRAIVVLPALSHSFFLV